MRNSEKNPETIEKNRIYFLDNLRAFMIFLVVVIHAGGASGCAALRSTRVGAAV